MVDNKKQRKSTRNFNMEKHVERHFDIEKEEMSVVAETSQDNTNVQPQGTTSDDNPNGSKNKMLVLFVAVLLAIVGFVAYRSCNSSEATVEPTDTIVSDSTENKEADTTSIVEKTTTSESGQPQSTVSKGSSESKTNAEPNNISTTQSSTSTSAGATIEEKAKQVWDGVYGNGAERKSKLGSDYVAVQKRVNEMYRNGYRH